MLAEFGTWWLTQMRSLVPALDLLACRQQDALIIAIDKLSGDETGGGPKISGALLLRHNGAETNLQRLEPDRPLAAPAAPHLETGLRLPAGTVLSRDVLLPIAAARNLQAAIGFEMDRLTPFTAAELYWGVSAVKPDRARGRVSLRLSIVPRNVVEALSRPLAQAGLSPSFIETGTGRIELDGTQPRKRPSARAALPALCAVLFVACVAAPFIRQQMALNEAARAVAALQPQADKAQALRQQLITAAAGQSAIAQARRTGDALQVLATLTNALPDDTWLTDLTLKSGDLTFDGQSTNAAKLIGLLSNVKGLHDPSFTAPVTRTADGKADIFSMHVSVGP